MAVKIKPPNYINFDKLLEPYRRAGTENSPSERTLGLIVDWLLNKLKFPKEIVGAAILTVFLELEAGLEFTGEDRGRKLMFHLRETASNLHRQNLALEADEYAKRLLDTLERAKKRTINQKFNNWMKWGKWK